MEREQLTSLLKLCITIFESDGGKKSGICVSFIGILNACLVSSSTERRTNFKMEDIRAMCSQNLKHVSVQPAHHTDDTKHIKYKCYTLENTLP